MKTACLLLNNVVYFNELKIPINNPTKAGEYPGKIREFSEKCEEKSGEYLVRHTPFPVKAFEKPVKKPRLTPGPVPSSPSNRMLRLLYG